MGMYGSPELHPAFNKGEQPDWNDNMVYCRKCGFKYSRVFDRCPQCGKKKRKHFLESWWFWAIIIIGLIYFLPVQSYLYSISEKDSTSETYTPTHMREFISEEDYKAQCNVISYEEIARNPNKYKGQKAVFKGCVHQVIENGKDINIIVGVTDTGFFGFWDDNIYVDYKASANESRILEEDIITMYGELKGLYTYQSVVGSTITIPHFKALFIDIEQ